MEGRCITDEPKKWWIPILARLDDGTTKGFGTIATSAKHAVQQAFDLAWQEGRNITEILSHGWVDEHEELYHGLAADVYRQVHNRDLIQ